MSDFRLELALTGTPVFTMDGRVVTDIQEIYPDAPRSADDVDEYKDEEYVRGIVAVIHNTTGKHEYPYYHNGGAHKYGLASYADLTHKPAAQEQD